MQHSIHTGSSSANWPAVWSMFVGVTGLITAEFLPISLLSSIAADIHISEGLAGQAVTASGVIAVITSLLLAPLSRKIDRRYVLLAFSFFLVISNLIVAVATDSFMLFAGRCLLGFSVGGFWTMSSAVAIRLVPDRDVPKALSIIYAGVSLATILAVPLGSYFGHLLGWRAVFMGGAGMGVVAFIWQFFSIPFLPPAGIVKFSAMFTLLRTNWVILGLIAAIMGFAGHFSFFTYVQPFMQQGLSLDPENLSLALLAFGISSCVGTSSAGFILSRKFSPVMTLIPLGMAGIAVMLTNFTQNTVVEVTAIVGWGLLYGVIPVGWSTWITRTLPEHAESAGGLLVAAIQFAITVGASAGGIMYDTAGFSGTFILSAILLVLASAASRVSFQIRH